ncbi:hypothetical protein Vafri_20312, partial [Volvox africanus]
VVAGLEVVATGVEGRVVEGTGVARARGVPVMVEEMEAAVRARGTVAAATEVLATVDLARVAAATEALATVDLVRVAAATVVLATVATVVAEPRVVGMKHHPGGNGARHQQRHQQH